MKMKNKFLLKSRIISKKIENIKQKMNRVDYMKNFNICIKNTQDC